MIASSLKRHIYYCRSKPVGQSKSRKRCCEACTRSKIRCDATFPSCSSCAARKLVCQYVEHALPNVALSSNDLSVSSSQAPMETSLVRVDAVNQYALDTQSDSQPNFDFNIFSASELEDSLMEFETLEPSASQFDLTNLGSGILPIIPTENNYLRPASPISLQWKPPKVLGQRSLETPQAQMATMMLAQIIASFPYMMTNKKTFPPFIHPRSSEDSRGGNELPEILKDCMGLAHMFHTKKKESNKMFWRSVRMEQEKLYAQVCNPR
jgi:hypothetical protein